MPDIKVHIHTPEGRVQSIEAPADLKVDELIEELIHAGTLPRSRGDGKATNWSIFDKDTGVELRRAADLNENSVDSGHHLYLVEGHAPSAGAAPHLSPGSNGAAAGAGKVCPRCGAKNEPAAKVCQNCGTSLHAAPVDLKSGKRIDIAEIEFGSTTGQSRVRCPNCGQTVTGSGRFCGACGAPLGPSSRNLMLFLHTPDGRSHPLEVSGDLAPEELTLELIKAGILPKDDRPDGPAQWTISDKNGGPALPPGLSLKEFGVRPGDHLYIKPLAPRPRDYRRLIAVIAIPLAIAVAAILLYLRLRKPPVVITIVPARYTLRNSGSTQFTAKVSGISARQVTWSTACPASTISSDGLFVFTEPESALDTSCTVNAVTPNGSSATATLLLLHQPTATLISVRLSPATAALKAGHEQRFQAYVQGTSNTAVAWSIEPSGAGNISPGGVFIAPAKIAARSTVLVRARSQADPSKSSTAAILLEPGPTKNSGPIISAGPKKPSSTGPPAAPSPPPPSGFGLVDVTTDPPGQRVFVDRKFVGTSPIHNLRVQQGVHRFSWDGSCANYIDTQVGAGQYARVKLGCS